jgi:hypothetical protein
MSLSYTDENIDSLQSGFPGRVIRLETAPLKDIAPVYFAVLMIAHPFLSKQLRALLNDLVKNYMYCTMTHVRVSEVLLV